MIRAIRRLADGAQGTASAAARLGFDDRYRRRLVVTTGEGERVLIDLAEATRLRHGDRLAMEDGRILAIEAEAEDVADLFAGDDLALTRLAWHLGNRHTPTAVFADRLRIRRDHVLEAMAERLGARVEAVRAPFDPEAGAYHDGAGHGHAHGDDPMHGHAHGDDPMHGHAHGDDPMHGHAHGDDRVHGHGHDHPHDHTDGNGDPVAAGDPPSAGEGHDHR